MRLPGVDPRDEQDLYWRFHFADGEIKSMASPGIGGLYEPIVNVEALRCGPIEVVPKPSHWHQPADIDWRSCEAAARAGRIDRSLRSCGAVTREVLWRAYGARVDAPLAQLGGAQSSALSGVLVVQPLLCNLVELAPEAAQMHGRSKSPLGLRPWLERHSRRAAVGRADPAVVEVLFEGACGVLERAALEYANARRKRL